MQKKILAMAVAAAVSAPAFADTANVTVYGKVDVSVDSIKTGTATNGTSGTTSNRVESNVTVLGFKGAEDLGDGLSAVWQIESTVLVGDSADNGTSTTKGFLGTRNTFLGLKDDSIGTVLAGRHDTPYKLATRRFDQFGDQIADNRSIMGGVSSSSSLAPGGGKTAAAKFDDRQDQVIAYISPSWAGVTVAAAHVNLTPKDQYSSQASGSANSIAAWYDANGLYATVAYESHNLQYAFLTVPAASEHAVKAGVGYTMEGVFNANIEYEKTSDDLSATGGNLYGHSALYISGKYMINDTNAVKAAYTKAGDVGGVANTGAAQYSLGYDHSLSKRTTVYALYTRLNNQSAAGYALSSEPTLGGSTTSAGVGASPSAIAIGMKVVF
jgi:predicted porin